MTCTSCGAQNDPGRKFCLECGTPLALACPACGSPNPAVARFCGACGGRLSAASAASAAAGAAGTAGSASAGATAERRLVSVLFADLAGFTSLAEQSDLEDVRDLLSRYYDLARGMVERHGGTVEKFIGDAVMAVWGTPTSHEDDAERAVRAALEVVGAVRTLGPSLQARAAVVTGEAAVTLGAAGQGMVAGDMVNTASRLLAAAPAGVVLVGEATMHAAAGAIAFEEAGEQLLRGKTLPVLAWRALRVVAERGGRARSAALEPPFVGRDDELRLVKDLFHATARERRVRLVSITGQAGIGKSRLAWEFLKYVDGLVETVWWHEGRSPSYGSGITFWALGEMVRRRAGLAEADDEATTRARIAETAARWLPDESERRWIEPALLALLGVGEPPPGDQEQLFSAWRTFFERIAAEAPVVMVFEDLQWADSGLLAFIDHLVDWSRGVPIYVLALARPELLDRRPDWGAGKRSFTSLALEPLPAAAVRELVEGLVPGLPEDAGSRIVARADGIPLYAVEIVRMLVGQGSLEPADGAYRMVGDLADLAVPETLHSLIAARLDALDPPDRSLLQCAAVLGQSFTPEGLAAVAAVPAAEVERRLPVLVRRELLVRRDDPRSVERGQLAFVQSLVREVAYSTLARRDRKSRHLAAARHLESLVDQELAGAVATHYLAASQNTAEESEADALAAQARIALRAAGDRAASLGPQEQGLGFYREALEVTAEPGDRAALLERAGRAASAAAFHEEAERLLGEAIELLRAAGDRSGAARVTGLLADAMLGRFRLDAALALLQPVVVEFADLGEDPGLATLEGQLARFQTLRQLDLASAIASADRALAIAERLDRVDVVADALVTRGTALVYAGREYEGIGCLEAGLHLAQRHGLLATEIRARNNLGGPLSDRDPRSALAVSRAGLEQVRRYGHRPRLTGLVVNACATAAEVGEWGWARAQIQETLAETTGKHERLQLLSIRAHFLVEGGEDADADLDAVEAWLDALVGEEPSLGAALAEMRGVRAMGHGDFAAAATDEIEAGRLDPGNAVWHLGEAILNALLARDPRRVDEAVAQLRATGTHAALGRLAGQVGEAGITAMEGDPDAARGRFLAAYAELGDLGATRRQALSGLVAARLLGTDHPDLQAIADESRRLFERMGAGLWLGMLDEALAAAPSTAAP